MAWSLHACNFLFPGRVNQASYWHPSLTKTASNGVLKTAPLLIIVGPLVHLLLGIMSGKVV